MIDHQLSNSFYLYFDFGNNIRVEFSPLLWSFVQILKVFFVVDCFMIQESSNRNFSYCINGFFKIFHLFSIMQILYFWSPILLFLFSFFSWDSPHYFLIIYLFFGLFCFVSFWWGFHFLLCFYHLFLIHYSIYLFFEFLFHHHAHYYLIDFWFIFYYYHAWDAVAELFLLFSLSACWF